MRSIALIKNLDMLLTISIGYMGFIGEKRDERISVMQLIDRSKRICGANKFVFYAIADGLFVVLSKCDMLKKKPKFTQLLLFTDVDFGWG